MSYAPTTWVTGDYITTTKLNKMEQGIANAGGSGLVCSAVYDNTIGKYKLDLTAQEIYDSILSGVPVYIKFNYGTLGQDYVSTLYLAPIIKIYGYNYTTSIRFLASKPQDTSGYFTPSILMFESSGLNGYPTYADTYYVPNTYISSSGGIT